jgi:hypothetical protein
VDRTNFIPGLRLRARNLKPSDERRLGSGNRRKLDLPSRRPREDQDNRERYAKPVMLVIDHLVSHFLSITFPDSADKWFIFHQHSRFFRGQFFILFVFIYIPGYTFILTSVFCSQSSLLTSLLTAVFSSAWFFVRP